VTEHLADLGHRRIAYLGNRQATRINRDRLRGYQLACEARGLTIAPDLVIQSDGSEIENGESAMEALFSLPRLPDAVFCFNDLMAIGALKTLQRRGVEVPTQLSLAGFDNIPYSAYTSPALTTFDQPKRLIGFDAASMLLELIKNGENSNGHKTTVTRRIRGELLVRESTAKKQNKENT
jgi:DNA-binding LacI/PurR family transcriptional regulator